MINPMNETLPLAIELEREEVALIVLERKQAEKEISRSCIQN